jgi:hypothetical protein
MEVGLRGGGEPLGHISFLSISGLPGLQPSPLLTLKMGFQFAHCYKQDLSPTLAAIGIPTPLEMFCFLLAILIRESLIGSWSDGHISSNQLMQGGEPREPPYMSPPSPD